MPDRAVSYPMLTRETVDAWRRLIPSLASLPAAPLRGILHWTGGGPRANPIDLRHYHFVFNQPDGAVVLGSNRVAFNMGRIARRYAAHTGGFNTGSVGFAFAGMADAAQGHRYGPYPLTEMQVRTGLAFVALSLLTWKLPVSEATCFTHYEAWTLHRVKGEMNDQKWDITELQFARHLGRDEVGPWMREVVRNHTAALQGLGC
ncbi:MAG TPA: hypothetical protein VFR37_05455 [Longimicrobium sp.]|nr:hypothetical protein [Longimicrobium sp.]